WRRPPPRPPRKASNMRLRANILKRREIMLRGFPSGARS
ncbi:MAG: hypothetical protein AVDCRST_MAG30-467, partial [uncultured Solirubrobacteraceae bacterium]